MGTTQLAFAEVVLPEVTWPEVTSATWPEAALTEVCSAQPEVAQYPPLFTGSDVSHVTGRGPVRKSSCAHVHPEVAQSFLAFFSYSCSSTSTMATEGHPEVRVSRAFFLVQGGVLYDVRVLYLAWLPELSLVIYPFPAIFISHFIFI